MVSLIDREARRPSMMELGLLWSTNRDREAGARGRSEERSKASRCRLHKGAMDGTTKIYIEGLTVNN